MPVQNRDIFDGKKGDALIFAPSLYFYSCASVDLNAPGIYVFLKMGIFKVIYFIFETRKTEGRKNDIIHYGANKIQF